MIGIMIGAMIEIMIGVMIAMIVPEIYNLDSQEIAEIIVHSVKEDQMI